MKSRYQTPLSWIDEKAFLVKKFVGKKDQNLKMNIFSIFGRASCFYAELPPPYVSSTTFGRLSGRGEYKWPLICVCSQSQTLTLHHPQSLVGQFSKIQIRIMMILCLFPALNSHITPPTIIDMDMQSVIFFWARMTAHKLIRMTVIYPPWPISIKASRILDIANILENIVDQTSNCCCWYLLVDALNGAPWIVWKWPELNLR